MATDINKQGPHAEAPLSLGSMAFAHIAPTDEAAFALADIWFGQLSGSVDSRRAQIEARRRLACLIKARMNGPPDRRTMAEVVRDAFEESELRDGTCCGDDGLEMILLNVTESRAAMYSVRWRRLAIGAKPIIPQRSCMSRT